MKFLLLVVWSQGLLCAGVFSQSTANKQVVSSLDKFTEKFYSQLAADQPKNNLFFSPLSISMAFFILSLGAKSETHRQILEGLSFDKSKISEEDISKGFQQLLQAINQHHPSIALDITNACFMDKELPLFQKFQDDLNLFQSEVISTDFKRPEEAKNQINTYVEEKTKGLIKKLLDSLDPDTVLTLINTIYFKGTWQEIFDKERTREEKFYVNKNKVVKVQMMSRDGEYPVAFLDGLVVFEVPYKGSVSAFFILPDKGKMEDVERDFPGSMKKWIKKLKSGRIMLSLPRFSASSTLDLKDLLRKLGITDVFSDNADLSGITGHRNLKVSKATHKAVVTVDEKGTEAAGATGIGIMLMSLPPQVTVNRPFMMTIIDKANDINLFTGRIINPVE